MRYRMWLLLPLALGGCKSSSSGNGGVDHCNALVSTLCKKVFECGAGGPVFSSEADCETKERDQLGCAQWLVPESCHYDWHPFDTCLADVAAESCGAASGQLPASCQAASAGSPPVCAGGPVRCYDHGSSGSNSACIENESGCSDGKSYSLSCDGKGACDCLVDGKKTQTAVGLATCSPDEAVLNQACGWNLFVTYRPPPPDLAPPADLTPGCVIGGHYYPPDGANPQNECQICQPTRSATTWSNADNRSCGGGGCGLCTAGACGVSTAAAQLNAPGGITVDANSLYFTDNESYFGSVQKAPLAGGAAVTLAMQQSLPLAVAVDASNAYFVGGGPSGAVLKVALGGGTPAPLASGRANPQNLAVDATAVYWVDQGTAAKGYADGSVQKVALAGGMVTPLGSAQASPLGIAVDGTNVYWSNNVVNGAVMKVPLAGGTPTPVASNQLLPSGVAVDANYLYWANQGTEGINFTDGTIMRAPLAGGAAVPIASGQRQPIAVFLDGNTIYWSNSRTGDIMKVGIGGGTPVPVVSWQHALSVQGVAVDKRCVYFSGSNAVWRTPK